jgi:hypothetical protein
MGPPMAGASGNSRLLAALVCWLRAPARPLPAVSFSKARLLLALRKTPPIDQTPPARIGRELWPGNNRASVPALEPRIWIYVGRNVALAGQTGAG